MNQLIGVNQESDYTDHALCSINEKEPAYMSPSFKNQNRLVDMYVFDSLKRTSS